MRSCRRCILRSWLLLHGRCLKWLLFTSTLLATLRHFSSLLIQLRFDFFKLNFENLLLIVQKGLLSDLRCCELYLLLLLTRLKLLMIIGSRWLGSLGLGIRCLVSLCRQLVKNWGHTWFLLLPWNSSIILLLIVIEDARTASPILLLEFLKRVIVHILVNRGLRRTIIEIEFQLILVQLMSPIRRASIQHPCCRVLLGRRRRILQVVTSLRRSETFSVILRLDHLITAILKSGLRYRPLPIPLH